MGVYNLVLFIVLGERSYLYYVLMLFSVAFHFATLEYGLSYQYLWPNQIVFNHIATIFFPSISMFFALNFAISFLQTKIYAPALHPYLLGLRMPYLFFMIFSVMQKINWTQAGLAFITVPALSGLLAQLAEMTRFNAAQKGLGFTYDAPAHMPGPVCGDQERLRQILLNLLKNAVKFTKHGEIMFRVKISINKLSDLPGTSYKKMKNGKPLTANIRFEIEDTGPGIPREQLEGIFQPFQQADQYSLQEGSTGLGLSVSQHLAILMGSRIYVSSDAGQGATFWLDLELPIAEFSLAKVSSESLISENTVPETGDHLKSTVAELPAEWLEHIKHAAKRADFMMLSNITANIRQHEPAIADMLEPLIEDFQYDEILALVQKTEEGDENPNS
ncbi:MAG: hypothetical protein GY749_42615 [Desulfobacteraceae bacterium]|nr:hypothetical protein [Desulfobacteraceae bacterium]